MVTDDNHLAARAANGDREAFRVLLERHYGLLYRVAVRVLAHTADAEDVVQNVCASLPRRLKSFRAQSRFTTWLYQVCLNACRDHLRGEARAGALRKDYGEVASMRAAEDAQANHRSRWLHAALSCLGDDLRETAVLVVAEGLSHREAGEVLDIKEATVSWRMHEVKKKLKVLAEAEHDQ